MATKNGGLDDDPAIFDQELNPTPEALPGVTPEMTAHEANHLLAALDCYDSLEVVRGHLASYNRENGTRTHLIKKYGKVGFQIIKRKNQERLTKLLGDANEQFNLAYGVGVEGEPKSDRQKVAEVAEAFHFFDKKFSKSWVARHEERRRIRATQSAETLGGVVLSEQAELVENPVFMISDPDARISLARALRPEFRKLTKKAYEDITEEQVMLSDPVLSMQPFLINSRWSGRNSYPRPADQPGGAHHIYTSFTPWECSEDIFLLTKPFHTDQKAGNRQETRLRQRPIEEREQDTVRRAANHFNEKIDLNMHGYVHRELLLQHNLIDKFREASQFNGGLARFGNEANMDAQLDYLWDVIVGDALWTTRVTSGQPVEWETGTRRMLEKGIYFAPTKALRLQRFNALLDVLDEWIISKANHMLYKGQEMEAYLAESHTTREHEQHLRDKSVHSAS